MLAWSLNVGFGGSPGVEYRLGDVIVALVQSLFPRYSAEAVGMAREALSLTPVYTVEPA